MRKLLRLIVISVSVLLISICAACSVSGEIGTVEVFFQETLKLKEYTERNDGSYSEETCKHSQNSRDDLVGADMDFCSYSSIGLTFKDAQNSIAEITTITFELQFEESCDFNLVIYVDSTMLYESGVRSYSAQKTYSFVVSEISYSSSSSELTFRNAPELERAGEPYNGYAARWKINYLQIVFQGR